MTITPDTLLDSAAVADCLSTRARNAMNHMRRTRGMRTVRDFASCRSSELLELRNCGIGTLAELTRLIREAGLKWAIPLSDQPKTKAALPKVVQLASVGDFILTALLDDGTIWWTDNVGRRWSYMVPPPPCTSPDTPPRLAGACRHPLPPEPKETP